MQRGRVPGLPAFDAFAPAAVKGTPAERQRRAVQQMLLSARAFGNASGPVPPFAPGILGPKGSLYIKRATLFTHIATREATQAMADDLFAVVQSGAVKLRIVIWKRARRRAGRC